MLKCKGRRSHFTTCTKLHCTRRVYWQEKWISEFDFWSCMHLTPSDGFFEKIERKKQRVYL